VGNLGGKVAFVTGAARGMGARLWGLRSRPGSPCSGRSTSSWRTPAFRLAGPGSDLAIDVNLTGVFFTIEVTWPAMVERRRAGR
jgi:NAD(P)-dependent dehydrogenase (short-subunit alcohol dehydrogenase family)